MPRHSTDIEAVVNHFFALKGWDTKWDAEAAGVVYAQFVRPAKMLLSLCKGDVERSCWTLNQLKTWAEGRNLSWSLNTAIKRWYDLPRQAEIASNPKDKDVIRESSGMTRLGDIKIHLPNQ
jgi:hypothetical protein